MKVNKVCKICGVEFSVYPGKKGLYCSKDCYRAFQRSGSYKIDKNRKWFNVCHVCGVFVGRMPVRDRNGKLCDKVFCSRACYLVHHDRKNNIEEAECCGCGKKFEASKRRTKQGQVFCSTDCRRKIDRSRECNVCGARFTGVQFRNTKWGTYNVIRVQRNTCSTECLRRFYRENQDRKDKISTAFTGDKHPNWQGGSHVMGNRGPGWAKLREKIRAKAGRKCEECGKPEEESNTKLEVHHKIPYHQFTDKRKANKVSNLEALCRSCHMKKDWAYRRLNPIQMPINWRKHSKRGKKMEAAIESP